MASFTIYPPRGDYKTLSSSIGAILGSKMGDALIPSSINAEQKRTEEFVKALGSLRERYGHMPNARDHAVDFVAGAVQNGTVKIRDKADMQSIFEMVDALFPKVSTAEMEVSDSEGNPTKVRVPTDRTLGSDADLERTLGSSGLSLTNRGQEPTFTSEGQFTGTVPKAKAAPAGSRRKDELALTMQLAEDKRSQERLDLQRSEAKRAAEEAERRVIEGKPEGGTKQFERESRGLIARMGAELTSENMDKASLVLKQVDESQKILLNLAGGRIKDNAVMWDNEGNQERYGLAVSLLEQAIWSGRSSGAAAKYAWDQANAQVPRPDPLPAPEAKKPVGVIERLREALGGEATPAAAPKKTETPTVSPQKGKPEALPLLKEGGLDRGKLQDGKTYDYNGQPYVYDAKSKKFKRAK